MLDVLEARLAEAAAVVAGAGWKFQGPSQPPMCSAKGASAATSCSTEWKRVDVARPAALRHQSPARLERVEACA